MVLTNLQFYTHAYTHTSIQLCCSRTAHIVRPKYIFIFIFLYKIVFLLTRTFMKVIYFHKALDTEFRKNVTLYCPINIKRWIKMNHFLRYIYILYRYTNTNNLNSWIVYVSYIFSATSRRQKCDGHRKTHSVHFLSIPS